MPYPPPRDLPDPGIEPMSFMSPALAGGFCTTSATWEAQGIGGGDPIQPATMLLMTILQFSSVQLSPVRLFETP